MMRAKALAEFYKIGVQNAYCHKEGNWYWNLERFPGAYFDADGCVVFRTEKDYRECVYLSIGPRNTGVRDKNVGMGISDIPGYRKLNPPPSSLWT
jgi:hypothetical protein